MGGRPALIAGLLAAAAMLLALGGPSRGARELQPDRAKSAYATGRSAFARMGCGGCHRLAAGGGAGTGIGPDLDARLTGYDARSLRARIVDPYAGGEPTSFGAMPQDYGARMSPRELDALVAFLLAARRG